MMLALAYSAAKRSEYPSGRWQPEAEGSQGLRRRLNYVWLHEQVRIWVGLLLVFVLGFCYQIVAARLGKPWSNALGVVRAFVSISNAILAIVVLAALSRSISKLLRSGHAVEGLVVGVSDDGIDRLYTIYYEDGPHSYEVQCTAKCGSAGGELQAGSTITLILGPRKESGQQQVVFDLRTPG